MSTSCYTYLSGSDLLKELQRFGPHGGIATGADERGAGDDVRP